MGGLTLIADEDDDATPGSAEEVDALTTEGGVESKTATSKGLEDEIAMIDWEAIDGTTMLR